MVRNYEKCKKFHSNIDFIIGDCGTGKSTLAAKIGLEYLKKGYPCYSNVYIEGFRQYTIDDLMKYDLGDGYVLILDEAATYGLASRGDNHKKNNTPNVIEFFTMYRHYKAEKIIIISPSFQDIIPVVRSRINTIWVCKKPFFIDLLLFPVNLILSIFQKNTINIGLVKFITKSIDVIGSMKEGSASEPKEVYRWMPVKRKYFLQNPIYKYFDSYCRRPLEHKDWNVWGQENKEKKILISNFMYLLEQRKNSLEKDSR